MLLNAINFLSNKTFIIALIINVALNFFPITSKCQTDLFNIDYIQHYNDSIGKYLEINEALKNPDHVIELCLIATNLKVIPKVVRMFHNLKTLEISYSDLSSLPNWLKNMKSIENITLCKDKFTKFPFILNKMKLHKIDMSGNKIVLINIHKSILSSYLRELDLSMNNLYDLPISVANLDSLRILRLESNHLSSIPRVIGDMQALEKVYLYRNEIVTFSDDIKNAKGLKFIFLNSNKLGPYQILVLRKLLPFCEVNDE